MSYRIHDVLNTYGTEYMIYRIHKLPNTRCTEYMSYQITTLSNPQAENKVLSPQHFPVLRQKTNRIKKYIPASEPFSEEKILHYSRTIEIKATKIIRVLTSKESQLSRRWNVRLLTAEESLTIKSREEKKIRSYCKLVISRI